MSEDEAPGSPGRAPFVVYVLVESALTPGALGLGWALGLAPLADFAWNGRAVLEGVLAAAPMIGLLAAALRWPVGPLRRFQEFFDREVAPSMAGCRWYDLALFSMAAGLGEEILFRGVIQAGLTQSLGPVAAVGATGALFGLVHPVSAAYVAAAGLLGTYLGVIWLATGNLLSVVVAHALYDFVALVALLHGRRRGDRV